MPQIILALDDLDLDKSVRLTKEIGGHVGAIKIHSLYDKYGYDAVKALYGAGALRVFVDAKLLDIPKTVGLRANAIARSGAGMLTVHASGGIKMMVAAVESGISEVFAVTILTSLSEEEVHLLHGHPTKAVALQLALNAKLAGVYGIVCSAKEVGILSKRPELMGLKFMVTGVRSVGVDSGDHQRTDTPGAATRAGATHLVIGEEITKAADPLEALEKLVGEVVKAVNDRFAKQTKHES